MDNIRDGHNATELEAHGLAVGLKEGLMGNSEVGHLNIGAGRIVWQDIVRIDQSEWGRLSVFFLCFLHCEECTFPATGVGPGVETFLQFLVDPSCF